MLSKFHCPTCGSELVYRSRPRGFTERFLLPFTLLRPVRCGECYRRMYALIFTEAKKRSQTPRSAPRRVSTERVAPSPAPRLY